MNIEINGNISDISAMLLSAERYALGRRTYIVEWTCSFIKKNLHLLTEGNKQVMIRDIEECENYGADFDKAEWMKLLKVLKEYKKSNIWISLDEVFKLDPATDIWCLTDDLSKDFVMTAEEIKCTIGNFDWSGMKFCVLNVGGNNEIQSRR